MVTREKQDKIAQLLAEAIMVVVGWITRPSQRMAMSSCLSLGSVTVNVVRESTDVLW